MNEIKKRLKSPVVWLAVVAQVSAILMHYSPEVSATVKGIAEPLIEIAVLFGILNNPTNKEGF